MDYPKLISEKWNLTAKFNCLQAIYFYAPSALAVPMCVVGKFQRKFIFFIFLVKNEKFGFFHLIHASNINIFYMDDIVTAQNMIYINVHLA